MMTTFFGCVGWINGGGGGARGQNTQICQHPLDTGRAKNGATIFQLNAELVESTAQVMNFIVYLLFPGEGLPVVVGVRVVKGVCIRGRINPV